MMNADGIAQLRSRLQNKSIQNFKYLLNQPRVHYAVSRPGKSALKVPLDEQHLRRGRGSLQGARAPHWLLHRERQVRKDEEKKNSR